MPNKITVYPKSNGIAFGLLEAGMLFRSVYPLNESNVYMKISGPSLPFHLAVLLTNGCTYAFSSDKEVEQIKTKIEITS